MSTRKTHAWDEVWIIVGAVGYPRRFDRGKTLGGGL